MNKLKLFSLLLLFACSDVTNSNANVSGTYCLDQFYYKFTNLVNNNEFTLNSSDRYSDSFSCLDVVQYNDSIGFFHLEGTYRILGRSTLGDTVTVSILRDENDYGEYIKSENSYYFLSIVRWLYFTGHRYSNGRFEGSFSFRSDEAAETLAVVWKK